MTRYIFTIFFFLCWSTLSCPLASGNQPGGPFLDIIGIEGEVFLLNNEGIQTYLTDEDNLKVGDMIGVAEYSFIDIAYEKSRDNVTRIRGRSLLLIRAVHPTSLYMEYGDLFARLNRLPEGAPFEVMTPASAVSVCGSVFRVTHRADRTTVYNFFSNAVYVYGLNEEGSVISETPISLEKHDKTRIENFSLPKNPSPMTGGEMLQCQYLAVSVDQSAASVLAGAGIVKALKRNVSKTMRNSLDKIYRQTSRSPEPEHIAVRRPKIFFARPRCKK